MKSTIDRHQVKNLRWRGELETEEHEWSPMQKMLFIVMLIFVFLL